jgi:hypothetical protein
MAKGIGRSRIISMSNTRKITARRKNRVENGIREDLFGSNPHSKGDVFSRSFIDVYDIIREAVIMTRGIITEIKVSIIDIFILST